MMTHTSTPQRPPGLRHTTSQDYLERMMRLQQYIAEHLDDEALDPDMLASVACMSRSHFHRVFRAMFGETIMQHLRRLRLERAAQRLRFHRPGLLDLALDSGYTSHEAFSRAFHAHFGVSPSAYRDTPSPRAHAAHQAVLPEPGADIVLRTIPDRPVMMMRHWGHYITVSDTFARLVTWSQRRGLLQGEPSMYGVFHDDPEITPEAQLRSDICLAIDASVPAEGEFRPMTIPGGTYAVAVHHGPYTTLPQTYLHLIGAWLPTSRFELCIEGIVEHYLNSPHDTAPADLRTEVRVRLQPA